MPSSLELAVSVVIPVHDGGDDFRKCLAGVSASSPAPQEIIVVADGDTDGSWRMAQEFGARLHRLAVRGGPARARNVGARTARGDVLFFVDADVLVPRDAVGQVAAAFQAEPDLVALFGSYDDAPAQTNFLSQYKNLFHHYVHQTAKTQASTFWGACGAVRREVFLAMGGFNEGYRRPSIEDIELGYRLRKAGYQIRLLKTLEVKHLKRWTVFSLLKADFLHRALPWTSLILAEGRFIDDLNVKVSSRVSVISLYLLLITLLGTRLTVWLLVPAVGLLALILGLNWGLYRFFRNKRGIGFTLKSIPWHWCYLAYSGLAFSVGLAKYHIKRFLFRREAQQSA